MKVTTSTPIPDSYQTVYNLLPHPCTKTPQPPSHHPSNPHTTSVFSGCLGKESFHFKHTVAAALTAHTGKWKSQQLTCTMSRSAYCPLKDSLTSSPSSTFMAENRAKEYHGKVCFFSLDIKHIHRWKWNKRTPFSGNVWSFSQPSLNNEIIESCIFLFNHMKTCAF